MQEQDLLLFLVLPELLVIVVPMELVILLGVPEDKAEIVRHGMYMLGQPEQDMYIRVLADPAVVVELEDLQAILEMQVLQEIQVMQGLQEIQDLVLHQVIPAI
jgi:hypothetical protein